MYQFKFNITSYNPSSIILIISQSSLTYLYQNHHDNYSQKVEDKLFQEPSTPEHPVWNSHHQQCLTKTEFFLQKDFLFECMKRHGSMPTQVSFKPSIKIPNDPSLSTDTLVVLSKSITAIIILLVNVGWVGETGLGKSETRGSYWISVQG